MAMKVLSSTQTNTSVKFVIHTDDTKLKDDQPDPDFVREFVFGKDQPPQKSLEEALRLCEAETTVEQPLNLNQ